MCCVFIPHLVAFFSQFNYFWHRLFNFCSCKHYLFMLIETVILTFLRLLCLFSIWDISGGLWFQQGGLWSTASLPREWQPCCKCWWFTVSFCEWLDLVRTCHVRSYPSGIDQTYLGVNSQLNEKAGIPSGTSHQGTFLRKEKGKTESRAGSLLPFPTSEIFWGHFLCSSSLQHLLGRGLMEPKDRKAVGRAACDGIQQNCFAGKMQS